ncbi:MAG: hypothetical protein ACTS41_00355 [Candidatus Hodgkinia cicadicola]
MGNRFDYCRSFIRLKHQWKLLHSRCLDKFDFIFNCCLNEIPLSLQPIRFTSLIRN